MAVVGYTTAPFVNSIIIKLPPFARQSKELLWRYTTHPPVEAEVEILTVRLFGNKKTTAVKVSDLYPLKPAPWRMANLAYVPQKEPQGFAKLFDVLLEQRRKFFIGQIDQGMKNSHVPGVLENVLSAIRNRSFTQ
jgi:hypothetical protein